MLPGEEMDEGHSAFIAKEWQAVRGAQAQVLTFLFRPVHAVLVAITVVEPGWSATNRVILLHRGSSNEVLILVDAHIPRGSNSFDMGERCGSVVHYSSNEKIRWAGFHDDLPTEPLRGVHSVPVFGVNRACVLRESCLCLARIVPVFGVNRACAIIARSPTYVGGCA